MSASDDMNPIRSVSHGDAIVVGRGHGVIWRGNDVIDAALLGKRAVAQRKDGVVELIDANGSVLPSFLPPARSMTLVARLDPDELSIAYLSVRGAEFLRFPLGGG